MCKALLFSTWPLGHTSFSLFSTLYSFWWSWWFWFAFWWGLMLNIFTSLTLFCQFFSILNKIFLFAIEFSIFIIHRLYINPLSNEKQTSCFHPPSNTILHMYPPGMKSVCQRDNASNDLMAVLFTIAKLSAHQMTNV